MTETKKTVQDMKEEIKDTEILKWQLITPNKNLNWKIT
jgi:hypothetical protein